jgi:hypothetical protein
LKPNHAPPIYMHYRLKNHSLADLNTQEKLQKFKTLVIIRS